MPRVPLSSLRFYVCFALRRAVLKIDDALPSINNVVEQCHTLARYAAICQVSRGGVVPLCCCSMPFPGISTVALVNALASHLFGHFALSPRLSYLVRMSAQEAGLVPIVEPEILRDGTHTLARCQQVTEQVITYSAS